MSNFFIEVGNKIRQHRKAARLTQEKLGERLSIDPSYIGKIERGEANITLETVLKIAEALHISPYDFFQPAKRNNNNEQNELMDKIHILLLNLHIDDLKTISRIMKDTLSLIKK